MSAWTDRLPVDGCTPPEFTEWVRTRESELVAQIEATEGKGWWSFVRDDVEPFELVR